MHSANYTGIEYCYKDPDSRSVSRFCSEVFIKSRTNSVDFDDVNPDPRYNHDPNPDKFVKILCPDPGLG